MNSDARKALVVAALSSCLLGSSHCGGRSSLEVDGVGSPSDGTRVGSEKEAGPDALDSPRDLDSGGKGPIGGDSLSDSSGGGSAATSPSCAGESDGLTDCGPSRESCCTSLEVQGGTFYRTYVNNGSGSTAYADPATVSGFRLDKYDVTVGRFRRFVAAWNGGAGYSPPAGSGKHTHLNGGLGLSNSGSPGTYEPGWLTGKDAFHGSRTHSIWPGTCGRDAKA